MSNSGNDDHPVGLPKRKHPAHGVIDTGVFPPVIFLTVCTRDRTSWLAADEVHELIRGVWATATAWLVGRYVLMPDHLHLFCAPGRPSLPLDNWVRYWKSRYTIAAQNQLQRWQIDHWDTRIRSWDHYAEKWEYVRYNPVRKRLALRPEDWPYQGELNKLY